MPKYPEIWQFIGALIGIYGVAFAIAAADPFRYWPVVFSGLLVKLLGPAQFLNAARQSRLPWKAIWVLVPNDLIWWIPFAMILVGAYGAYLESRRALAPEVLQFALRTKVPGGDSIAHLSKTSPVLLVFMRHIGCTFCREAMSDLAQQRRMIEASGTRLVLVHMGGEEQAVKFFRRCFF